MPAFIEVDALASDSQASIPVWHRRSLDGLVHFDIAANGAGLSLRTRENQPLYVELTRAAVDDARWFVRVRNGEVFKNGTRLVVNERYSLENGDRLEVEHGNWLRFLDDSDAALANAPPALPRLREVSRVFLFAPTPADGAERWRAIRAGRSDVLVAQRIRGVVSSLAELDDDMLHALPGFVDALYTPAGLYHVIERAAGVSLADVVARTRAEGATLDASWAEAIVRDVEEDIRTAVSAGWRPPVLAHGDIVVTWDGHARYVGFGRARDVDEFGSWGGDNDASQIVMQLSRLANELGASRTVEPDHVGLAGMLAALFPDEHRAELALLEEVQLWTRDGLAELERVTRGRPSP